MKKSLWLIIAFQIIILSTVFGQDKIYNPFNLAGRFSILAGGPLSQVPSKSYADGLIHYENKIFTGGSLSADYFFNDWGIEIFVATLNSSDKTAKDFESTLEAQYPDYFLSWGEQFSLNQGYFKMGLGPAYRWEHGHWLFISRLQFGVALFHTDTRRASLKRNGTNEIINLEFNTPARTQKVFLINPGIMVGYRIAKRVAITADLNYSVFDLDVMYTLKNTSYNPDPQTVSERQHYEHLMHELNLGIGMMFFIQRRPL